jgi:hypothetical protein
MTIRPQKVTKEPLGVASGYGGTLGVAGGYGGTLGTGAPVALGSKKLGLWAQPTSRRRKPSGR